MSTLKFTKMHGLGNDFMVIDGINQRFEPQTDLIRSWADRHFGIGFDQLLLVENSGADDVQFRYRIFNADGGEVSQCGNGARCFARFVREKGLTDANPIAVETASGHLLLDMIDDTRVRVNMGIPRFEPENIPLAVSEQQDRYRIDIDGKSIDFSAVSMGNPHMVMQIDDVQNIDIDQLGPALESHPLFPQRVNVGFMQIVDRNHFKLRVFERGVGETQACGSGACAAMVAGIQLDLLENQAKAGLLGGNLQLDWQGPGQPVMMTGATSLVFDGEIDL